MTIETKAGIPVTEEMKDLVNHYDFYTQMIESSAQRQSAYEANRKLEIKLDRKSTRLNSSHTDISRMPSSA